MTSPRADIEHRDRPRAVIARLHGDIDSSNAAGMLLPLAAEAAGHPLILALDDVQYIDSAGLAAIDTLRGSSALYIVTPRDSVVRRALEIAAFDQLIPVFDRMEDVLAASNENPGTVQAAEPQ
jgi:anti-anti-sigma factor